MLPLGLKTAQPQYQRMVQWCLEQCEAVYRQYAGRDASPPPSDSAGGTPGPPELSRKVTEVAVDVLLAQYIDLRRFCDILSRYKLTVKREKMFLFKTRKKFCVHILQHGIPFSATDKRAAIQRWDHKHIVTPTHLKAFLGLTQWYAMYMKNYAMHAAILSEALTGLESNKKKGDRSGKRHKIGVREKETYALVAALDKLCSLIQSGVTVRASTDHQARVHWFREDPGSISGPVRRRGRWHEFLFQFHFEVEYRKGEDNVGADTMSRWAYQACEHAPDACMHGSEEDLAGVERDVHDEKWSEDHTWLIKYPALWPRSMLIGRGEYWWGGS